MVLGSPEGKKRCQASWQSFTQRDDDSLSSSCHAGLKYLGHPVRVGDKAIALVAAAQFTAGPVPMESQTLYLKELSRACGLDSPRLLEAARQVPVHDPRQIERISRVVRHTADSVSEMGYERSFLLGRLQQIAEMTVLE
jgi:hypothetical protein